MKKKTIILLTSILMLLCMPALAGHHRHYYRVYSYATKTKLRGGEWSDWSQWRDCDTTFEFFALTFNCRNAPAFTERYGFSNDFAFEQWSIGLKERGVKDIYFCHADIDHKGCGIWVENTREQNVIKAILRIHTVFGHFGASGRDLGVYYYYPEKNNEPAEVRFYFSDKAFAYKMKCECSRYY